MQIKLIIPPKSPYNKQPIKAAMLKSGPGSRELIAISERFHSLR